MKAWSRGKRLRNLHDFWQEVHEKKSLKKSTICGEKVSKMKNILKAVILSGCAKLRLAYGLTSSVTQKFERNFADFA